MAKAVADTLVGEELVTADVDRKALEAAVEALMLEELTVEDRLNDEVRQILTKFDSDIAKGRLDYRKLFDLTKQKLVRERGIVL
jgi:hypothetical protein